MDESSYPIVSGSTIATLVIRPEDYVFLQKMQHNRSGYVALSGYFRISHQFCILLQIADTSLSCIGQDLPELKGVA
jgi:hypothetical protein